MFIKTAILSAALALACTLGGNAVPIAPKKLIVFSPRITSPNKNMVWRAGSTHNVTWDTADIPHERHGSSGLILLGHWENNSENLDIKRPLASHFPIEQGQITVTVPRSVAPRDDYFVVLFGDSGNVSPKFKITKN